MPRLKPGQSRDRTQREPDETRLMAALRRAGLEQPSGLTRRHGILNIYWVAVEELGARRGPRALEALVARGFLRRDPACAEIGRLTPAAARALGAQAA